VDELSVLQAQIGSAPQNTLFVKCVAYKLVDPVLVSIIGGTVAAACVLVVAVLLVYCYARRRCASRDTRSPPISIPLTTVNQLAIGPLVRPGYRRNLSVIRDSDDPSQTRNYPTNAARGSYIHTRDSALYNNGAYRQYQRYLRPPSIYPPLYENLNDVRRKSQEYVVSSEQYAKRRTSTAPAIRPASLYPEDLRSSTDENMVIRRPKIGRQNTQSLYPNDSY